MGVLKTKLAAKESDYISLFWLFVELADKYGDDIHTIARYLFDNCFYDLPTVYYKDYYTHNICQYDGTVANDVYGILQSIIRTFLPFEDFILNSDFDFIGFYTHFDKPANFFGVSAEKAEILKDMYMNKDRFLYNRLELNKLDYLNISISEQIQSEYQKELKRQIDELEANITTLTNTQSTNLQTELATAQAKIKELESVQGDGDELLSDKDQRTVNNIIRLILAINQLKTPLSFDAKYNKSQLESINQQLELLGYPTFGKEAYKTLAEMVREAKSKGL